MMECLRIDRTAEHGDDGVCKNQIDSRQDQTADHRHDDRIAHALLCSIGIPSAQADADKGTAAVTDHDRNRQGNHRQWEYDGIGRIAIGAKITGIGNEDLVNDVVQGAHQQ